MRVRFLRMFSTSKESVKEEVIDIEEEVEEPSEVLNAT